MFFLQNMKKQKQILSEMAQFTMNNNNWQIVPTTDMTVNKYIVFKNLLN